MDPRLYLLVLFVFITLTEERGPHHPRGGKIVKRHVHYRPTKNSPDSITHDAQLLHDKEHIQDHLEDVVKPQDLSTMTDEQLEFYYFQLHDVDKNNMLDGLEILQAIFHIDLDHEGGGDGESEQNNEADVNRADYIELVDKVLKEDDLDSDGYLSYPEYVSGRQRANLKQQQLDLEKNKKDIL